ncbi:DUF3291 domain-containing protein [Nocardiopsis eucommiae]|uniref:DUF3291 domain-containing protein n=1 Tax=Nocardiopsis eucommiae TaxID=2831970 RepID=A0A975L8E3_9ACTN|nr:DUF3291 domain-containing protein [Nocardiopsis eucommiae]
MRSLLPTRTVRHSAVSGRPRRGHGEPAPQGRGTILVESRTVTGDPRHLPALVAAFRARAEVHPGHLGEVHFSDDGASVRTVSRWRSSVDLRSFVERAHGDLLAYRVEAGRFPEVERTLWWSRSATAVTPEQAEARAVRLKAHGPGPGAFTLGSPVPAPARAGGA